MTKDEAIAVAIEWLGVEQHAHGTLRYARYMWDFRSGWDIACDPVANPLFFIPSPLGGGNSHPFYYSLRQGWLIVFNPWQREAENSAQCIVVWVDEPTGEIRGKIRAPE